LSHLPSGNSVRVDEVDVVERILVLAVDAVRKGLANPDHIVPILDVVARQPVEGFLPKSERVHLGRSGVDRVRPGRGEDPNVTGLLAGSCGLAQAGTVDVLTEPNTVCVTGPLTSTEGVSARSSVDANY